jgi:GntR family transcriptional regulator
VTADDAALHALRRRRAQTLAGEFLHQMHALSLTETEIETLLRETAQQQTEE